MTLDDLLEYQTADEAITALGDDLSHLVKKARRAREVGDQNNITIIHRLIDEELDLMRDFKDIQEPDIGPDHTYPAFSG